MYSFLTLINFEIYITREAMLNRLVVLITFAWYLTMSVSHAQNRFYNVYLDTDNNPSSGCQINIADFSTSLDGIDSQLTITTDSALPPAITSTQLHHCTGASFDAGTSIDPAALGLNTGLNGSDVFEASIVQNDLSINQTGSVIFYFVSGSDTGKDVVLNNSAGGPIYLGFTIPVPALGLLSLTALLLVMLFIVKKHLSRNISLSILLVGVSTLVWALDIIVDGQTSDWLAINPANTDPANDTSGTGSFADLTAVFVSKNDDQVFVRMDVVDVENQAPTTSDVTDNTLEDNAVTITVTGSDAEGAAVTFNVDTNPSNGTLSSFTVVNSTTSTIQYTPDTDFNGSDSFTFVANDGQTNSAPATVTVNVNPVNDAPFFTAGSNQNVLENAPAQTVNGWATAIAPGPANEAAQTVSFNVTNNNNTLFSVQPAIDTSGNLTFTPAPSTLGTATVSVSISDNGGTANGGVDTSTIQTFDIDVTLVNDEPSFTVGPNQTVNEDAGAISVAGWASNILAGPPDESGQMLTFNITANDNPSLFSAGPAVAANGTLTFTTAADANGTANITLELMDDGGTANGGDDTSPPQNFSITITPVNDEPSYISGGDVTVDENSGLYNNAWATAISPGPANENSQTLTFNIVNVSNNTLFAVQPTVDATGNLSFTPASDEFGTSTVTINLMDNAGTANGGDDTTADITFDITVSEVNEAPVLANIPDANVDELTSLAFTATATDPNVPVQNLTFSLGGTVPAGASITPTGDFTWTPTEAQGTTGSFTFDVIVTDDGTNPNNLTDTQSITVTVNKVNSAPVLAAIGAQSLDELTALNFSATATDNDDPSQNLTFSLSGTVPTGASISTSGAFSWTPTEVQGPGSYTFDVVVTDNGTNPANLSDAETITVTVNQVNTAPVLGTIGNLNIDEETNLSFVATATDSDLPTQTLSFSLSGTVPAGASISPGGLFSWTPTEAQGAGNYTFDVVVTDDGTNPANLSDSESITVTVNEVNAAPIANAQSTTTDDATPLVITLTGSDPEGATLNFAIDTPPSIGSLGTITPITATSAQVTYTPSAVGTGDFTFTVNDGTLTSAAATVTLPVTSSNTAPTGVNDAFNVTGNVGINVPTASGVTANDTDPEFDSLTVTAFDASSTQGGTVLVNANGSFTYDPPAGYIGSDSFNYTVSDGSLTDTATVNLTVTNMIWFIDNSAAAGGDGRLTSPFNTISDFNGSATDAPNEVIFIDLGDGSSTGYDAGITLLDSQRLIGQGVTLNSASAGITFPAHTRILPVATTNPTLVTTNANSITLGSSNIVRGLTVGNTGSGTGITGSNFGTLTVSEVSINGTGKAVDLSTGTATITFDSLSSIGSSSEVIDLSNVTGTFTTNGGTMSDAGANSSIVFINNSSGTIIANFNGINVGENNATSGENSIHLTTTGSATGTLNINNSNFTGSREHMILAEMYGSGGGTVNIGTSLANTFTQNQIPNPTGSTEVIAVIADGSANVTTNIINNTLMAGGATTFEGDGIYIYNKNTYLGEHRITISNNTFGIQGVNGSAFNPAIGSGHSAINLTVADTGDLIALVNNNNVYDYNSSGIEFNALNTPTGKFDITITNNTVSDVIGANSLANASIFILGNGSAETCVDIRNNTLDNPQTGANAHEIAIDVLPGAQAYRTPGLTDLTEAGLAAYLATNNTIPVGEVDIFTNPQPLTGGGPCVLP